MASVDTVAVGLAVLQQAYPTREVTAETIRVFATLFGKYSDEQFVDACQHLAAEDGRRFFPTPGEIVAAMKRDTPPPPAIDVKRLLYLIGGLGTYSPHGTAPATPAKVAEYFGQHVANAYGTIGPRRLVLDGGPDHDWARKELAKALEPHAATLPPEVPRIGEAPRYLPALRLAVRERLECLAPASAVPMLTAGDAT